MKQHLLKSIPIVVSDVDAAAKLAVAAGATLLRPVANQSYGHRNCKLVDPLDMFG